MFTLGVSDHVMIAHSFADPFFGPAQNLHGATYSVDLEIRRPTLDEHQVVMDIGALRTILRTILAGLEYKNLDEHPAFPGRTSTTERVGQFIAIEANKHIAPIVSAPGSSIRVLIRESPVAYAAVEIPIGRS